MKNIKKITITGIMTALSVILIYLIHFPIFPVVPFLEYDPGDIPIFVCTYLFGPIYGITITIIASVIQGLTVSSGSGWVGVIMHIFATGGYVLSAGFLAKKLKTEKGKMISAVCGIITMTLTMILWNMIFIPIFNPTMTIDMIIPMLPYIIAFNLIKAITNSIIAMIVYKTMKKTIFKSETL